MSWINADAVVEIPLQADLRTFFLSASSPEPGLAQKITLATPKSL